MELTLHEIIFMYLPLSQGTQDALYETHAGYLLNLISAVLPTRMLQSRGPSQKRSGE